MPRAKNTKAAKPSTEELKTDSAATQSFAGNVGKAAFWKTEIHTKHPMSCLQEMCIKMRIPAPKQQSSVNHVTKEVTVHMWCEDRHLTLTTGVEKFKLEKKSKSQTPVKRVLKCAADIMLAGFYEEHVLAPESQELDDVTSKDIDTDYPQKLATHQRLLEERTQRTKEEILKDDTISEESRVRRIQIVDDMNNTCEKPAYDNLQVGYLTTSQNMVVLDQAMTRNRLLYNMKVSRINPDGSYTDASEKTPRPEVRAEELMIKMPFSVTGKVFKYGDTKKENAILEHTVIDRDSGDRKLAKNACAEGLMTRMIAEGIIKEALPELSERLPHEASMENNPNRSHTQDRAPRRNEKRRADNEYRGLRQNNGKRIMWAPQPNWGMPVGQPMAPPAILGGPPPYQPSPYLNQPMGMDPNQALHQMSAMHANMQRQMNEQMANMRQLMQMSQRNNNNGGMSGSMGGF